MERKKYKDCLNVIKDEKKNNSELFFKDLNYEERFKKYIYEIEVIYNIDLNQYSSKYIVYFYFIFIYLNEDEKIICVYAFKNLKIYLLRNILRGSNNRVVKYYKEKLKDGLIGYGLFMWMVELIKWINNEKTIY